MGGALGTDNDKTEIAQLLTGLASATGDRERMERLLYDRVYDELRSVARSLMRGQVQDASLRPTELVHEAYLRLTNSDGATWQNRAHFFGAAAKAMRQCLVDEARKRAAAKRGGEWKRVTLDSGVAVLRGGGPLDLAYLDAALSRLARLNSRMVSVVEMRVFAGMPSREVACALGVSVRTVDGDWAFAKKWLQRELSRS